MTTTMSICRTSAALGALMAMNAGAVMAQSEQPKVRSVVFSTVKAGRVGDFLAANKETVETLKKAGSERGYTAWVAGSGPREYAFVRYHNQWAELDAPQREPKLSAVAGQLTALGARIGATIESSRRVLYVLDHDLSIPMGDAPTAMVQVLRTWVRPDQIEAYRTLIKSDVLAAAKKSGMKTYGVAHVRGGGANQEYNSVTELANWAALDGVNPIVTGMGGQAAYDKFLAKLRPLVSRSEYEIYRYLPDQSYLPPRK